MSKTFPVHEKLRLDSRGGWPLSPSIGAPRNLWGCSLGAPGQPHTAGKRGYVLGA